MLWVVIAIVAGSLLHLLPHRALEAVVGALFLIGAILRGVANRVLVALRLKKDL